jgi:serine/threonine protein kinase
MVEELKEKKELRAYVIDLGSGIAKGSIHTSSNVLQYSPLFSAPEINIEELDIDAGFYSDIWSLGCVLYFMVSE